MNALDPALNEEFTEVFGVKHNWTSVIANSVVRRANKLASNGLLEDVITDIVGDLIMQVRSGTFAKYITIAKEASKTDVELVDNLKYLLIKAAYYRASDMMRGRYRGGNVQFSQVDAVIAYSIADKRVQNIEETDYPKLLTDELEIMATAADWQRNARLAKRLRLAKQMVPDRLNGMAMKELMEKYEIKSKGKMHEILTDLRKALAVVAMQTKDEILIRGIAEHQSA